MRQLGNQPYGVGLLNRHRVLAQPDAVFDKRISAGAHDAVEAGVPAFGEGIFCVFGDRLHGSLQIEQSLGQFGDIVGSIRVHKVPQERINPSTTSCCTGIKKGFEAQLWFSCRSNMSLKFFE